MTRTLHCSFCGKAQAEVLVLIAGPGVILICDECVDGSAEIVAAQRAELCPPPPAAAVAAAPAVQPPAVGADLRWIGIDDESAELQEVVLADGRSVPVWTFQAMGQSGLFERVYVADAPLHECNEARLIRAAYRGDQRAQIALTSMRDLDLSPSSNSSPQGGGEKAPDG